MWILPKTLGGLGIIDTQVQSSTLYFRWLQPLLAFDQSSIGSHPVSYMFNYHIRNINQSQYHQIPLLFPCSRTQGLRKQRTGTIDMLYKAMDYTPCIFQAAQINPATALVLPLQAVFYVPTTSSLSVYQYNSRQNFLHWKDTNDSEL